MNDLVPDSEEEFPEDDLSPEQYREAAEATLQRLMAFLKSFENNLPAQTNVSDIDDPNLAPGALYSIRGSEADTFQVVKVLALDDFGVHVRLYGNAFTHRPTVVAPDLLDTAPFFSQSPEDAGREWPLSVGHLPLLAATFISMRPVFITRAEPVPGELEDYNEWKEAGGGYL